MAVYSISMTIDKRFFGPADGETYDQSREDLVECMLVPILCAATPKLIAIADTLRVAIHL